MTDQEPIFKNDITPDFHYIKGKKTGFAAKIVPGQPTLPTNLDSILQSDIKGGAGQVPALRTTVKDALIKTIHSPKNSQSLTEK